VAADRLENFAECQVLQQSACAMELPDDSFDFVVSRLVLEHLPEPGKAAREILRVLKPGGTAVIIDNDFDLHECTLPACPSLKELYAAYRRARRAEGGNPCIGRELPVLLESSGFEGVNLHVVTAHSSMVGVSAFLRAEGSGIPAQLVKNGYLSAEALERIAVEWMRMLQTPGNAIFRVLMAGVGRKPGTSIGHDRTGGGVSSEFLPTTTGPKLDGLASPRSAGRIAGQDGLMASSEPLTPEIIRQFMQETLAAEMGIDPEELDCAEPLIHQGVDSIAAMHLCNRFKSWLSTNLPVAEILCGKSVNTIADEVFALITAETSERHQAISPQPRLG
jgi:acyl carrier protein